jgi:hypothetical protein
MRVSLQRAAAPGGGGRTSSCDVEGSLWEAHTGLAGGRFGLSEGKYYDYENM